MRNKSVHVRLPARFTDKVFDAEIESELVGMICQPRVNPSLITGPAHEENAWLF